MIYQNYHKHTMYSNVRVPDSVASYEQYAAKANEYGHGLLSSVEHGWQGRYIEAFEVAKKHNLKFLFGTETYFVLDRKLKDPTNAHMILLAKNENGRKAINRILSEANMTGFYYQPRIDFELLLSLPKNDVWVTSACLAGILRYTLDRFEKISTEIPELATCYDFLEEPYEFIAKTIHDHFGDNFFIEVQSHHTERQLAANRLLLPLAKNLGIKLIAGVDSHYISDDLSWERDEYLASRGMHYEDEDGWFMDYPDGDTFFQRFKEQGLLSDQDIVDAINQTNTFLTVEEYDSDVFKQNIKMPILPMYSGLSQEERNQVFIDLIYEKWGKEKENISPERLQEYEKEIAKEIQTVIDINHADYFLLDYNVVNLAAQKGGVLTSTSRGSSPSFYLNKLLGLTSIDALSSPVLLYPERFLSKTRILESKSLADIDLNCANVLPFWEAQEELLGKGHSYPMITFGTYKVKSAWKLFAKSQDVAFETTNAVSAQLDNYLEDLKNAEEDEKEELDAADYIEDRFKDIFEKSKVYRDIVASISIHPCFTGDQMVITKQGSKAIKDINSGDMVLGERNKYNLVKKITKRESSDLYEIDIVGVGKIVTTGNHPFFCSHDKRTRKGNKKKIEQPGWVSAESLVVGDFLPVCVNQEEIFLDPIVSSVKVNKFSSRQDILPTNSADFWWIVGRYIGDGWLKNIRPKDKGERLTIICCAKNEAEEIAQKMASLGQYGCYVTEEKTVRRLNIQSKNLYDFLDQFGHGAKNKHLTSTVMDLPKSLLLPFLDGYFSADGHIYKKKIYTFTTVSKQLAHDIAACINKVFGVPCRITNQHHKGGTISGRAIKENKAGSYVGNFIVKGRYSRFVCFDGYIWVPIKDIKKLSITENVYNLEVDGSHTFNVSSVLVHNCSVCPTNLDILSEIGLMQINDNLCCILDGKWAEEYKFLKNDFLTVSVVDFIKKTYDRVGVPRHTTKELLALCTPDHPCWNIYKNGWTVGINQCEQSGSRHKVAVYKPKNISELSAFVAAIRPGFKSMYDIFEKRQNFEYGIPAIDNLIRTPQFPQSYMLYQEQAMKLLNYSGIPMDETYDIIKAIAKKRPEKVLKYRETFLAGVAEKIQEDGITSAKEAKETAERIWQIISDSQRYSFNACLLGSTIIDKVGGENGRFVPTIEEMYKIRNDFSYAKKTGHLPLHKKLKRNGFGIALSLYEDGRVRKNRIIGITYSGFKPVYLVKTDGGLKVTCTSNHKFPTPEGEKFLSELTRGDHVFCQGKYEKNNDKYPFTDGAFEKNFPTAGQKGFQKNKNGASVIFKAFRDLKISESAACETCHESYSPQKRFEIHHKDFDRTNNIFENYSWLCASCHKKVHYAAGRHAIYSKGIPSVVDRISSIELIGEDHVYDVEMEGPAHNLVVNGGLVVSNSHSLSVALDSLYGAYLKSTYPLEFYETYLRVMEENSKKDKMLAAQQEATTAFNIRFLPLRFGQDNRQIVCHPEDNTITASIQSLKGFSKKISYALYMMKDYTFDTFIDLLYFMKEKTPLNVGHISVLIALNYFEAFGGNLKLKKIFDAFNVLYDPLRKIRDLSSKIVQESGVDPEIVSRIAPEVSTKEREYYFYHSGKGEYEKVEGENLPSSLDVAFFQTKMEDGWHVYDVNTGTALLTSKNKVKKKELDELLSEDDFKKTLSKIKGNKTRGHESPRLSMSPETLKFVETKYLDVDVYKLLVEAERCAKNEILGLGDQVLSEKQYLSYISTYYEFLPKVYCYVEEVDLKYKPRINLYTLGSGKKIEVRVKQADYNKCKIVAGDFIKVLPSAIKKTQVWNPPDEKGNFTPKVGAFELTMYEYTKIDAEKMEKIVETYQNPRKEEKNAAEDKADFGD